MNHATLVPLVVACLFVGCSASPSPRGQLVLHVTTDAPLPTAPGEFVDPNALPALFDRVLVELFPAGASSPCSGCSFEFAFNRSNAEDGSASIGIVPAVGETGVRARVRMFRARSAWSASPRSDLTVERVVLLPVVNQVEIQHVTVVMQTDDVGNPAGSLQAPVAALTGRPPTGIVGTWPGAQRVECVGGARPGEVCVPGGAFWTRKNERTSLLELERLVIISPFYLDADEVTVGAMRNSSLATATDPSRWSGSTAGTLPFDWCTYTDDRVAHERDGTAADSLPVNCVSWELARSYCTSQAPQRKSADLPTEMQFEFAQSVLGRRRFPWGEDVPECGDSVFARAGSGILAIAGDCAPKHDIGGPLPIRSGAVDRVQLPSGTIYDLAGNVSEWIRDRFQYPEEGCWPQTVLQDPLCTVQSAKGDPAAHAVRGGAWAVSALTGSAGLRASVGSLAFNALAPMVGFRCQRPATP